MRLLLLGVLFLGAGTAVRAQSAQSKTDSQLNTEYEQAQKFYNASNFVAALPLFEDLYAQQPASLVYEERLAMSLLGASASMTPEASKAAHARAKRLLLDAQSHGDTSPLLTTLLEKMGDGDNSDALPTAPLTPAKSDFAQGEKLFGTGDMKAALALYQRALDENPTFYLAALYAGDALFKAGDCAQAGVYYAKATAIDPDHETAFRYWGDCLVKQHDMSRAKDMYISAIIADPYHRTPRQSLATWAEANHARLVSPPIKLPAGPTPGGKPGDMNITLDASGDSDAMVLGILYTGTRISWQKEEFQKHFPSEKAYRHSLPEEAAAIRSMLPGSDIESGKKKKKNEKKNPSIELLTALEKDGMLECWILFDNPDQGIAQDYIVYRKDHRDLMHRYIEKYDVHPM